MTTVITKRLAALGLLSAFACLALPGCPEDEGGELLQRGDDAGSGSGTPGDDVRSGMAGSGGDPDDTGGSTSSCGGDGSIQHLPYIHPARQPFGCLSLDDECAVLAGCADGGDCPDGLAEDDAALWTGYCLDLRCHCEDDVANTDIWLWPTPVAFLAMAGSHPASDDLRDVDYTVDITADGRVIARGPDETAEFAWDHFLDRPSDSDRDAPDADQRIINTNTREGRQMTLFYLVQGDTAVPQILQARDPGVQSDPSDDWTLDLFF